MKLIVYKICFLVFIIYWLVTFFFVFPKNPLNVSVTSGKDFFHANFFQTWGFFAPPPNFNERVYLVTTARKDSSVDIAELLDPVFAGKHNKAPFNSYHQAIDYIMASSLAGIDSDVRMLYNIINYEKEFAGKAITDSLAKDSIIKTIEQSSAFKTLVNYARKSLLEKNIDPASVYFQIKIVRRMSPQFVDRFTKKMPEEEITFASHALNF